MIDTKLEEYRNLLDFKHEDYGKDFKNNYKFIKWAVNRMRKQNTDKNETIKFIEQTIKIHKQIYV